MGLRLGDIAPDFEAQTTKGDIKFHEWIGNSWVSTIGRVHKRVQQSHFSDAARPSSSPTPVISPPSAPPSSLRSRGGAFVLVSLPVQGRWADVVRLGGLQGARLREARREADRYLCERPLRPREVGRGHQRVGRQVWSHERPVPHRTYSAPYMRSQLRLVQSLGRINRASVRSPTRTGRSPRFMICSTSRMRRTATLRASPSR